MPTRLHNGEGRTDREEAEVAPVPIHRGSEHGMSKGWSGSLGEVQDWWGGVSERRRKGRRSAWASERVIWALRPG